MNHHPSLAQALEAQIKAITADFADKQRLVSLSEAAAVIAEKEAGSIQLESVSKHAEANIAMAQKLHAHQAADQAKTRSEADLQELIVADARAAAALEKSKISQRDAFAAQQTALNRDTGADMSQQAATTAQARTDAAKQLAVDAQDKAVKARETLEKLNTILLPLRKSLDHSGLEAEEITVAGASSRKRAKATISSYQPVILVQSNALEDVLAKMRLASRPAVYDFQGRMMVFKGEGNPTIVSSGVTWRNGKIFLEPNMDLVFRGCADLNLESITVLGGACGASILSGNLIMTSCEFSKCGVGVQMAGSSSLQARNLCLADCTSCGLSLADSCTLTLAGGTFTGAETNIFMNNDSSMVGTGVSITGTRGPIVTMLGKANLSLTGCKLAAGPGCDAGHLYGQAALVMSSCSVYGEVLVKSGRANMQIHH